MCNVRLLRMDMPSLQKPVWRSEARVITRTTTTTTTAGREKPLCKARPGGRHNPGIHSPIPALRQDERPTVVWPCMAPVIWRALLVLLVHYICQNRKSGSIWIVLTVLTKTCTNYIAEIVILHERILHLVYSKNNIKNVIIRDLALYRRHFTIRYCSTTLVYSTLPPPTRILCTLYHQPTPSFHMLVTTWCTCYLFIQAFPPPPPSAISN